ncbi:MAG TPA: hypothetical protein VL097_08420 [Rhodanobacter sp.]|nr:hypothetical protein [Rhodanobacter sp.]
MKINHNLRKPLLLVATLSAALALGACQKGSDANNTAGTMPPATVATPATPATAAGMNDTGMNGAGMNNGAVTVASVDLGSKVGADNRITAAGDSFAPKDSIYATVLTNGTGTAKLDAKWTYQDGQVVHEDTKTINANGEEATSFMVSKPDGFPAGSYKLTVSLNGSQVASKDFTVK